MGYVVGIRDIKEVLIQEDNKVIIVCANYKSIKKELEEFKTI